MDLTNRSTTPTTALGPTRPASARPQARSSKRDKIVRSATKLFLEQGYDNVSINDIIDVVGGSKGTIYSNFGSKEKLFEAVVEQMCSDVTVRIDTRLVGTLDEQLIRIAQSFVAKVLSPQILTFHRLMTSIGRTFPAAGRLFYNTGPRTAYQIIAGWIPFISGAATSGATWIAPPRGPIPRHADRRGAAELADIGIQREGPSQADRSDGPARRDSFPSRLRQSCDAQWRKAEWRQRPKQPGLDKSVRDRLLPSRRAWRLGVLFFVTYPSDERGFLPAPIKSIAKRLEKVLTTNRTSRYTFQGGKGYATGARSRHSQLNRPAGIRRDHQPDSQARTRDRFSRACCGESQAGSRGNHGGVARRGCIPHHAAPALRRLRIWPC